MKPMTMYADGSALLLLLGLAMLPLKAQADVASGGYDVRSFGAEGDGVALDTSAINAAIDKVDIQSQQSLFASFAGKDAPDFVTCNSRRASRWIPFFAFLYAGLGSTPRFDRTFTF